MKNNDEVIAFFTSDIVRDLKQPVMQAGHKEGYLTKRGKNFGGWKTRFFVLQGPVLEYYDCVSQLITVFKFAVLMMRDLARRSAARLYSDHRCTDCTPASDRTPAYLG